MSVFTWFKSDPCAEIRTARTEAVELEVAGRGDSLGCQWSATLRYTPKRGISRVVGYAPTLRVAKREAERAALLLQRDAP